MEKNVKVKKPRKKLSKGGLVLIIGCSIILIPCLVFGGILLAAAMQTGTPVNGNRFDNDLNPAITNDDTSALTTSIEAISGVEKCEIELTSAQYRINVDVNDTYGSEEIQKMCEDVYNAVNSKLPVSTYFTANGSMKMYDLAINVYNKIDSDTMVYYILTKNSKMSEYAIQCVSEPLDEELAKELRGEIETSVGTGDVTVEGEEDTEVSE